MVKENFSHIIQIGIIVSNAALIAERLKTILGWEPWGIWETSRVPGRIYHGKEEDFACKMVFYAFPNIEIEIIQPLYGKSCWQDFLDQNGPDIHHLLFDIDRSEHTEAELALLGIEVEQRGRALPYGENVYWAYLASQKQLGFTMELTNRREYPKPVQNKPIQVQGDFSRLIQIGIVVRDAYKTAEQWKNVLGWEPSLYSPIPADKQGSSCLTILYTLPNIEINLMEPPQGKSHWQDFLDTHGEGIHHLLFTVDNKKMLNSLKEYGITFLQESAPAGNYKNMSRYYLNTKELFGFQIGFERECK